MAHNPFDQILFAMLFTLLLAALLGVLLTWIWAMQRMWRGIPLLAGYQAADSSTRSMGLPVGRGRDPALPVRQRGGQRVLCRGDGSKASPDAVDSKKGDRTRGEPESKRGGLRPEAENQACPRKETGRTLDRPVSPRRLLIRIRSGRPGNR